MQSFSMINYLNKSENVRQTRKAVISVQLDLFHSNKSIRKCLQAYCCAGLTASYAMSILLVFCLLLVEKVSAFKCY